MQMDGDRVMGGALQDTPRRDRGMQLGIAALAGCVLLVLCAVLVARLTGFEPAEPALGQVADSRTLGFRDSAGGFVDIFDWETEAPIARFGPGEGSFLRGVMRSLVRQRRGLDIAAGTPFELTRYRDDRLIIRDPVTGEQIDLVAFGPSNAAVFAALLEPAAPADTAPYNSLD
jgi:putative photosynthetic complex assembly protein